MILLSIGISNQEIYYALLKKRELLLGREPLSEFTSAAFAQLIEKIVKENNISPSKIFFSIFREDTLIHQLTLPKMSKEEVEEVIRGEIERLPAFAEKEYKYIYSLFNLDERRIRVIFCALSQEIIEAIIEGVKKIKTPLESIEIAPLNFLPLVYKLTDGKKDGALVVLDGKISYVVVFFGKECRLFYSAGVGIDDFFFKGKMDNLTFSNWVEELKRIFKSYCVEYKKESVERIWLVWDEEKAPLLDQILSKEIGKEVEKIDITEEIKVSQEEFNSFYLGAVSPIISYLKKYHHRFPFEAFLREIKLKRALKKGSLLFLAYLIIVGFLLGNMMSIFRTKAEKEKKRLKEISSKITRLEKQTQELRKRREEFLRIRENLLRQAFYVRRLNRVSWSKVFGEVAENLPRNLALSSFSVSEKGEVKFRGESFKIESIAELMHKIDHLTVLKDAKFDFLRESKIEDKKIFNFGILAQLRREPLELKKNEKK